MSIKTTTHLNFRGDARAALAFYQSVFGGQVTIATYGDFGMPKDVPGAENIVFGQVETADGFSVMAYDIPGSRAVRPPMPARRTVRTAPRSPTNRSSSRFAVNRSKRCRVTGPNSLSVDPSSRVLPRRRGAPDSACSPMRSG